MRNVIVRFLDIAAKNILKLKVITPIENKKTKKIKLKLAKFVGLNMKKNANIYRIIFWITIVYISAIFSRQRLI